MDRNGLLTLLTPLVGFITAAAVALGIGLILLNGAAAAGGEEGKLVAVGIAVGIAVVITVVAPLIAFRLK